MSELIIRYLLNAIFSAIPALGFAMVFNVPKHTLIYCAAGGCIAFTSRYILIDLNMSIELATFISSTIIGMITFYWSRKYKIPRPVYTVASIIPLLPGTYAFTAMIALIDMNSHVVSPEIITHFVQNALKAMSILAAIGFGLALPSLYFMRYNRSII